MKFLREPLFHFLLIGAALFGVYRLMNGAAKEKGDSITITADQVKAVSEAFSFVAHRPPSKIELDSLIGTQVRDEVLVREARSLGLDQEDGIIRERLLEKMRFVLGDSLPTAVDRIRGRYTVTVEK